MSLEAYSPEFRCDHDLPFVQDGEPGCEQILADLIIDFVNDELPAIGIVSDENSVLNHKETHLSHQALIMRSIRRIKPRLLVDSSFTKDNQFDSLHTGLHRDGYWPPRSKHGLTAMWKLHTAGHDSKANVLLANSSQGSIIGGELLIGDAGLYKGTAPIDELLLARGYDLGIARVTLGDMYDVLKRRSYEPAFTEPDVYSFVQPSLGSILFKAVSAVGPSTVHDFRAVTGERKILTSDMIVVTSSKPPS